jgi:Domain of unknown function (DUF4158)
MTGDYPRFRTSYAHEAFVGYFLLTPIEHQLLARCRGDVNRHGVAVLLKSLHYLGYFPATLGEVPTNVKTFISGQLQLLWEPSAHYPADARTRRYHLTLIRQHTGWRAPTADDKVALADWLRHKGTPDAPVETDLLVCAYARLRTLQIELPAEQELRRVVRTVLEMVRRIEMQTEKHLHRALLQDLKRVAGKVPLLFRVAKAVVEAPDGTIRDVLFPRVKEETFRALVAEAKASGGFVAIFI